MIHRVRLGADSYDIIAERGSLARIKELLSLGRRVMIVTDTGVPEQYASAVASVCEKPYTYVLEQGEASKNHEELFGILTKMTWAGFERRDCVVAVGGGVCGDIAGLAAAVYMRGIDFYNVPTTLLAQVDSSVGGKTGIDLCGIKNVVGAFKQPARVIIDADVLSTLPMRQVNNGLCEALKMAATSDPGLFELFERGDVYGSIDEITDRSLRVKIGVVEADEKESGLRKILNFGHTVGHGIEAAASPELYHGECVALGMLAMCSDGMRPRLISIYEKLGIPRSYRFDKKAAAEAILHDKKSRDGKIDAVYVNAPGEYEIKKTDPSDIIGRMEKFL